MPEPQLIQTIDTDGVRTLTLNRPDVLNAFNEPMMEALGKAIRATEKDKTARCLVITGAGRAFCSGQDLADVRSRYEVDETFDFASLLRERYNPVIAQIRSLEKPVIAMVNGVAAGAGCSLALACDMRIAAKSASFIQSFVNVGLIPDCGATFMLPRLVGVSRAMEMACTGRRVSSEEAERVGLVNKVVPDAELASSTSELADKLANMPTKAIGLIKRAINEAWNCDLEGQLDYEAMLQNTAATTKDHREGVRAFIEKTKAKFVGE